VKTYGTESGTLDADDITNLCFRGSPLLPERGCQAEWFARQYGSEDQDYFMKEAVKQNGVEPQYAS
jgi:hypothetical protein